MKVHYSLDSEMGVIGSVLCDPATVDEMVSALPEEAFYLPAHQLVYRTIVEMQSEGRPVEPISLQQRLVDLDRIKDVGAATVAEIYTFVPNAAHIGYYIAAVREKWVIRRLASACSEIASMIEEGDDTSETLAGAEKLIMDVGDAFLSGDDRCAPAKVVVGETVEAIEASYNRAQKGQYLTGISTGFPDLDNMTSGWQGGQLIVVAARPGTGKTSIARGFIRSACAVDTAVLFFSAEMSRMQTTRADLAAESGIPLYSLRSGEIEDRMFPRMGVAAETLARLKLFTDDTSSPSIAYIGAKSRRMKSRNGVGMIVIDYLQLCKSNTKRGRENRQIEVAEISGGLKALAKDLDVPVICLAQLNRDSERRADGIPKLSDLRESGAIEQDADTVLLLHRPERDDDVAVEKASLIVAKQREGETGTIELQFDRKTVRFATP